MMGRLILMVLAGLGIAGCASGDGYANYSGEKKTFLLPYSDYDSAAEGAAWTGSHMFPRKQMPQHERNPANEYDFYFKHCSSNGNQSYFSKTSYDCSGPYFQ